MVRSKWKKTLLTTLTWAGLTISQAEPARAADPVARAGRTMTVQEMGKPGRKCVIVKSWTLPDGAQALQVRALDSGEMMTLVESGPLTTAPGSRIHAMATQIFHWRGAEPPAGCPVPPPAVVHDTPAPAEVPAAPAPIQQTAAVEEPTPAPVKEPAEAPKPAPEVRPAPAPRSESVSAFRPVSPGARPAAPPSGPRPLPAPSGHSSYAQLQTMPDGSPLPGAGGTRTGSTVQYLKHPLHPPRPRALAKKQGPAGGPEKTDLTAPAAAPAPPDRSVADNTGRESRPPEAAPPDWKPAEIIEGPVIRQAVPAAEAKPGAAGKPAEVIHPAETVKGPQVMQLVETPSAPEAVKPPEAVKAPEASKPAEMVPPPAPETKPLPAPAPEFTPAAPPAPAKAPADTTGDFRQSWGKPEETRATAEAPAPLPHAEEGKSDPLKEPDKYSPAPVEEKVKRTEALVPVPANPPAVPEYTTPAAAALGNGPESHEASDKRPAGLFGKLRHALGRRSEAPEYPHHADLMVETPTRVEPNSVAPGPMSGEVAPIRPLHEEAAAPVVPVPPGMVPVGAQSVLAAGGGQPGQVQYVPVPVVTLPAKTPPPAVQLPVPPQAPDISKDITPPWSNAFTPRDGAAMPGPGPEGAIMQSGNAFYRAPRQPLPPMPYGGPLGPGGVVPPMPPGMGPNGPMYPPGQPGMVPAAYPPGYPAGYPAPMVRPMSGLSPDGAGQGIVQASYRPGTPTGPVDSPVLPTMRPGDARGVAGMLDMLRNSLYPSQREWAADTLASGNPGTNPQVVDALLTAAAQDPAATVRAGCVRALVKMNAHGPAVRSTLQSLKSDGDPRVRLEAEQALAELHAAGGEQ